MSQVINTNVLSLNAQRNLSNNSSALAQSLERLSSGLRINSAKDDAAGLAISERFTTQINGLNQAVRNANDGISLAQTGEAALQEVQSNLQRIRQLAVQAVNATNSDSDRATLDQGVQQRLAEIGRTASQTSFNGRNVLDSSFGNALFQVGANVGQTISLDLTSSVRTIDIGAVATATSDNLNPLIVEAQDEVTAVNAAFVTADLTSVTGFASEQTLTFTAGGTTETLTLTDDTDNFGTPSILAAAIDALTNVTATESSGVITITAATVVGDETLTIGGTGAANLTTGGTPTTGVEAAAAVPAETINLGATDLTIQIGSAAALSVAAGNYATVQSFVDAVNTALAGNASATLEIGGDTAAPTAILTVTSGKDITIGGAQANLLGGTTVNEAGGSLDDVNVLTRDDANTAISRIDSALAEVSDLRSTFGAIQNRFESVISSLSANSEALSASRSRIRDADFAAETAELTRVQILQQAGISVLSQANAAPQSVLALLQ